MVCVDFSRGFVPPEMVKTRLCIVLSKPIQARPHLCTVVPLSTTAPQQAMPYHCEIDIPFDLPPRWTRQTRWLKGDMIYSVSFDRTDLLRLGKDSDGKRRYQKETLSPDTLRQVRRCVLHGLGLSELTRQL